MAQEPASAVGLSSPHFQLVVSKLIASLYRLNELYFPSQLPRWGISWAGWMYTGVDAQPKESAGLFGLFLSNIRKPGLHQQCCVLATT